MSSLREVIIFQVLNLYFIIGVFWDYLIIICQVFVKFGRKMSVETPKSYDKKLAYTSPIGLLKNYNTINAPSAGNIYEEEFYKIKAQRLEGQLEQLKEQNTILRAKLTESTANNQILKEKIHLLENNHERERSYTQRTVPSFISDSGYPSINNSGRQSPVQSKYFSISIPNEKTQRSTFNAELERLLKENRVLKNEHEMEMSKVRDQNKRMMRRIAEIESANRQKPAETEPEIFEKSYRQKQDERYLKIQKVNNDLRKENEQFQKEKRKLEEKLKTLEENIKTIRRENEELKVINTSRVRNTSSLEEIQASFDQKEKQYKQQIQRLRNENSELQAKLKTQPTPFESKSPETSKVEAPTSTVPNTKGQKQNELLRRKITFQQQALTQKDEEIKNILLKLKPLMEKQKNKSTTVEGGDPSKRASLSILEVFLKKYKINSF